MARFRKKPIVVEAVQFTGDRKSVQDFVADGIVVGAIRWDGTRGPRIAITTAEGTMYADPGDWIIREPYPSADRHFYPCKPDIFEATYEPTDEEGGRDG